MPQQNRNMNSQIHWTRGVKHQPAMSDPLEDFLNVQRCIDFALLTVFKKISFIDFSID